MKAFSGFLDKIARKTVEILAFILFACITITGAFRSAYLENGYGQKLFYVRDSLLLNLLFCALLFGLLYFLAGVVGKNPEKRRKILLVLTLVYTFVLSLGWAAVSKCFPTADQASVYYGAKHFAADYYAEITDKYSYFSCYPHQMGLAFFYELILRLFHTESYHVLQAVNALCNVVTVLSLYQVTNLLFPNKKVSIYFLLLTILCFPLYWYTPFVYGELPSFAFAFFGLWMLLLGVKKMGRMGIVYAGISLLSFTCAAAIRKNTLILIVAVGITLLVYLCKERRFLYMIYLILIFIFCNGAIPLAIRHYENRSHSTLNAGVPGISHVVMGLQEAEYAPGWYNGFNFETYAYEADYDQEKAVQISRQALGERQEVFRNDPGYAFQFLGKKFMAEWLNTGYACYDSTAGKYYERHPLVESLYSGAGFYVTRFFMDKYQFFIYLAALFFFGKRLFSKKKEEDSDLEPYGILSYILPATVLGGALFYLAWEGSGRYILPYFIMTLPCAAAGAAWLDEQIKLLYTIRKEQS
ncbi:MAG: hypothetical protein HDR27_01095 [Lachnospiraceae bacterium]|nr:hypothetical protein [Lachnospiraceae bacterium]